MIDEKQFAQIEGMLQSEILALLKEASTIDRSDFQQVARIQVQLGAAILNPTSRDEFSEGKREGLEMLLDSLYVNALQNAPEMLPLLFPVFALLCGLRSSKSWLADSIDWELFKSLLTDFADQK